MHEYLIALSLIIVLGIGAQWIAWRFGLPSILLLLLFGLFIGPITGFLDPNKLLGNLFEPLVSISVAVILFEGGLSLKIKELKEVGKVVTNLISLGVLITWATGTLCCIYILKIDIYLSVLIGAILVVSGPTVIGPLLIQVKPEPKIENALKWESILIDPIGVILSVIVFEIIVSGGNHSTINLVITGVIKFTLIGVMVSAISSFILMFLMKRYLIPDYLKNPFIFMTVVGAFTISNLMYPESGLLAVTIMGIILTNQTKAEVHDIIDFKEDLRVMLISFIFILLSAKLKFEYLSSIGIESIILLTALIFIARPLSVLISSIGSDFNIKEKIFLSFVAPRGIVAAAVVSIFAIRLEKYGFHQSGDMIGIVFFVIIGTVTLYGLMAVPLARLLKISQIDAQGILFLGANLWTIEIAAALLEYGLKVMIVDNNRYKLSKARMAGIPVMYGNILDKDYMPPSDMARFFAVTSNDELNSLAVLNYKSKFGSSEVYQIIPYNFKEESEEQHTPKHLRGRYLFDYKATYEELNRLFLKGALIKRTAITEEFSYEKYKELFRSKESYSLFLITKDEKLKVFSTDYKLEPQTGDMIISITYDPDNIKKHKHGPMM